MSPHKISTSEDFSEDGDNQSVRSSLNGTMSEPTIPSSDNEVYWDKCHWLGSISFKAIHAEHLFHKSDAKTSAELNVCSDQL